MTTRTLIVQTQAKLGAMDRVLGALTHRGIIPETFNSELSGKMLQISTTFSMDGDHDMKKLCKFLDRQVYILRVKDASENPVCEPMGISTPPFPQGTTLISA
jgi:acetolactate synthase small subunit